MRGFIRRLAEEGMAVFVSSHLLSEIQLLCDRVAIIGRGRVLAVGQVDELIQANMSYVIWELEPREPGERLLRSASGVSVVNEAGNVLDDTIMAGIQGQAIVTQMQPELIPDLVGRLVREGVRVEAVQKVSPTLEQLFLEMTEGESIE
ncbi:hypothetical protein D3C74_236790 [compost metagenome]